MTHFAGWQMPLQYSSVREEQTAVRTATGVFDVSHMGRLAIEGGGAGPFLDSVVTNSVGGLEPGQARYTLMCDQDGGILDDLIVYREPEGNWRCVVNAAGCQNDLAWMRERAPAGVRVEDRTQTTALIAVQGPGAERLLAQVGPDLSQLGYFEVGTCSLAGASMSVSRTGYTGEDGFELFVPAARAAATWKLLIQAGAAPCGLAARDVLRLEAGLRLCGSDMDRTTNPYEVGLGWTVKLDKPEFVGRAALAALKSGETKRSLVGLVGAGRDIPRHGAQLGEEPALGWVTSGTYSFWLKRGIGFGLVNREVSVGSQVSMAVHGGWGWAEISRLPFYRGTAGKKGGVRRLGEGGNG